MPTKPTASERRNFRRIDFQESDLAAISTALESAMTEGGHKTTTMRVSRNGGELQFTVPATLQPWARKLSDELSQTGDNGSFETPLATTLPEGSVTGQGQGFSTQEQAVLIGLFKKLGLV